MRIDFLGFGEAGRAFQESLKADHPQITFRAWDRLLGRDPAMAEAMDIRGVTRIGPDGFGDSDWIISAVTADQSLLALKTIAGHISPGQWIIDINSVSPGRKTATDRLVSNKKARYLDMAVMAPVNPKGHKTPVLLAGHDVEEIAPQLTGLGFDHRIIGTRPGQATAIKMVRSLFVKGLEAITVECLLAAEASGCHDEISASLAKSFPGLGWPEFSAYEFERTLRHGSRRAAEMRESAATISELGLHGPLAAAIADVQDAMGAVDVAPDASISEILAGRLG